MTKAKGLLYSCDFCGKTEFLKMIGPTNSLYYRYESDFYEAPDNDWTFIGGLGDLCPECYAKYKRVCAELKEAVSNEDEIPKTLAAKFSITYRNDEPTGVSINQKATIRDLINFMHDNVKANVKVNILCKAGAFSGLVESFIVDSSGNASRFERLDKLLQSYTYLTDCNDLGYIDDEIERINVIKVEEDYPLYQYIFEVTVKDFLIYEEEPDDE